MEDVENLIQASLDKDYNRANEIFGDIMGLKISDALEQQKIDLANQIYNGVDLENDEFEVDDLELEDEDLEEDDEDLEEDEDNS